MCHPRKQKKKEKAVKRFFYGSAIGDHYAKVKLKRRSA
jgi:hypothetical protein